MTMTLRCRCGLPLLRVSGVLAGAAAAIAGRAAARAALPPLEATGWLTSIVADMQEQ
jgi:hypothetical protein